MPKNLGREATIMKLTKSSLEGQAVPPPSRQAKLPEYDYIFREGEGKGKRTGYLFRLIKHDWWRHIYATLVYFIQALPVWLMPLVVSDVIDLITLKPEGYITRIWIDAALFFGSVMLNVPTTMWRCSIIDKMMRRSTAALRSSVIRKLQRLAITYHKEMESGVIQSKLLRDIDNAGAYYGTFNQGLVPTVINVIVSVVIALYKNPWVALFFLCVVPFNVLYIMIFRKTMRVRHREFRKKNEEMSTKMTTLLTMLPLSKAHGLEAREGEDVQRHIQSVMTAGLKLDGTHAIFGSLMYVVRNVLGGLCLFFCVLLAVIGRITAGEVALFYSLFGSINTYIANIVGVYPQFVAGKDAVNSLFEIINAEDIESASGEMIKPFYKGEVEFENVSYHYPKEEKDVVKNFNLQVKEGECIAIVGSSGSGKSTVINLLIGLIDPTDGSVKIDGVPMTEIDKQNYRHFISVVPQNSILFSGTIRENITYGLECYTEEELLQAVEDADIHEFLASFPKGLDTLVGEHGDKLSGGQRQRICIARALIRNPRILILDEATSALDNMAEYYVQKAVNREVKRRTTFIVAHRLSTIRHADRIVVMENGEIVELGSYEELMALGGKFSELERLSRIREEEAKAS